MKRKECLDNFWNGYLILFLLFFIIVADALTCIFSVSCANQYPHHVASVSLSCWAGNVDAQRTTDDRTAPITSSGAKGDHQTTVPLTCFVC